MRPLLLLGLLGLLGRLGLLGLLRLLGLLGLLGLTSINFDARGWGFRRSGCRRQPRYRRYAPVALNTKDCVASTNIDVKGVGFRRSAAEGSHATSGMRQKL